MLAYFDGLGTSNVPTEAVNCRLEHLRGAALGFRNLALLHHPFTARHRRIQTPATTLKCDEPDIVGTAWHTENDTVLKHRTELLINGFASSARRDRAAAWPRMRPYGKVADTLQVGFTGS